jgi:hypothetical protein
MFVASNTVCICVGALYLEYFKTFHENKSYTLVQCWRELNKSFKWKVDYAAYKKSLTDGR